MTPRDVIAATMAREYTQDNRRRPGRVDQSVAEAVLAALAAAGWSVVPKEATEAMLVAGLAAFDINGGSLRVIHRAMVAAAEQEARDAG